MRYLLQFECLTVHHGAVRVPYCAGGRGAQQEAGEALRDCAVRALHRAAAGQEGESEQAVVWPHPLE